MDGKIDGAAGNEASLVGRIAAGDRHELAPSPFMSRAVHDSIMGSMPGMPVMHHVAVVDSGEMNAMLMPGMLTPAQMQALADAHGITFDRLFLEGMIRHHEGGLAMARYAEAHGETAVVRALAKSIADSQTGETELMTGMLTQRGGTPLPAP